MRPTMTLGLLAPVQLALAITLAPAALWMTAMGHPDHGLIVSLAEERVVSVFPAGPSWYDGVRPGHRLVELVSGPDPSAWRIITAQGDELYGTSYERQLAALRAALPTGGLATLLAGAALFVARLPRASAALAALSLVLAGLAVTPGGHPTLTTVGVVAGLLAPALWLVVYGTRRRAIRLAIVAFAGLVGAAWVSSRYFLPEGFDLIDAARQATVGGATLSTVLLFGNWRRIARRMWVGPATWADTVAVAVLVGVSVVIVIVLELPLVASVGLLVPALLLYPRFRRVIAASIDRVVLGDVRDRASIRAVEDERSRIARDLHDAPLQEIAAVIRQLDGRPGTEHETELLRGVADHLRRMTTELRPPILDDLGLPAAIAYVAEQAAAKAPLLEIQLRLEPDGPVLERPPPEVELAVFRIVQEAADNALEHASAHSVTITAAIAARQVTAIVEDDGRGVSESDVRRAVREGHFGFASMSQRAALIGASLRVDSRKPAGTRVMIEWQPE